MHIPLPGCANKQDLFRIIEIRPHTFSISGHTHTQANLSLDAEQGWKGAQPHHHLVCGSASGSWWCGMIDELGIPHATMSDGVPNGYSIISFDGNRYSVQFKAARRPADYQMNIYCPNEIENANTISAEVLVNFFTGCEQSRVEMRLDDGEWTILNQTTAPDPECARMYKQSETLDEDGEERFGWKKDKPSPTPHMWKGPLPAHVAAGVHLVAVRATDRYGRVWTAQRLLRVR